MLRLEEIAWALGLELVGDGALEVDGLKYAQEACESSLALARTEAEARQTRARAVLTKTRLTGDKSYLYSREIGAAAWLVARLLIAAGIYPDYEKAYEQRLREGVAIGANVEVGEGSRIGAFTSIGENVRIGRNCRIESGVYIGSGTEIGDGVKIGSGARVGVNCFFRFVAGRWRKSFAGVGVAKVGAGVEIGANTVIHRGSLSDTIIGAGTLIGNLVEIGHDVKIGAGSLIVSQVGICGNARLGERVEVYGKAAIAPWIKVGDGATVLMSSAVTKNVGAGQTVSGQYAREHRQELKRRAILNRLAEEGFR